MLLSDNIFSARISFFLTSEYIVMPPWARMSLLVAIPVEVENSVAVPTSVGLAVADIHTAFPMVK